MNTPNFDQNLVKTKNLVHSYLSIYPMLGQHFLTFETLFGFVSWPTLVGSSKPQNHERVSLALYYSFCQFSLGLRGCSELPNCFDILTIHSQKSQDSLKSHLGLSGKEEYMR